MGRLNLVIADPDETYVQSLTGFLIKNYALQFNIFSFSNQEYLKEFFAEENDKADILLISTEFHAVSDRITGNTTVISLNEGKENTGTNIVNKYQHVDVLVREVINCFLEKNKKQVCNPFNNGRTKTVAVYSPAGGAGKTTVAVSSCIQCAQRGLNVFYLNLENIQSTRKYFDCDNKRSFSHILFYLKDKIGNLALRIESTCCIDPLYNIHYFMPPDSILEMDEMLLCELETLVLQLKSLDRYDIVFIDMSSSFDKKNLALMEYSDEIYLVITGDTTCEIKLRSFYDQLELLSQKNNSRVRDKIIPVINKCTKDEPYEGVLDYGGKPAVHRLPFNPVVKDIKGISRLAGVGTDFTAGINRLTQA